MVLELQLKNPGHEEEEPAGWQDMGFQTLPAPLLQNSSAFLSLHIESLSVSAWGFVWKVCVFCLRGKKKMTEVEDNSWPCILQLRHIETSQVSDVWYRMRAIRGRLEPSTSASVLSVSPSEHLHTILKDGIMSAFWFRPGLSFFPPINH